MSNTNLDLQILFVWVPSFASEAFPVFRISQPLIPFESICHAWNLIFAEDVAARGAQHLPPSTPSSSLLLVLSSNEHFFIQRTHVDFDYVWLALVVKSN
jgi:hypothetical protein